MDDDGDPVVFLMGPTASGKTALATALFHQFDFELISVDAAQVYRGMNIGTAKPDPKHQALAPHHLIDIRNPNQGYSAADFRHDALALMDDIHARGKVPLFVGGTQFYFSVLENGLSVLPPSDETVRREIAQLLENKGLPYLYHQLETVDPVLAKTIRATDTQRVSRAIEIYRLTKKAPSRVMQAAKTERLHQPLIKMTLFMSDRSLLHSLIADRFEGMLESGLIDETEALIATLDHPHQCPAMKIVGYRQVFNYLEKKINANEMKQNAIAATRQLAKRQLTWLRQQSNVVWFDVNQTNLSQTVSAYLRSHYLLRRHGR